MSELLPLPVVAFVLNVTDRNARQLANKGKLGAITAPPGFQRKRVADRAEVEKRFGAISEESLAEAWARYRRGEHVTDAERERARRRHMRGRHA